MKQTPQEIFKEQPVPQARKLTPKEVLQFYETADFLTMNFHEIGEFLRNLPNSSDTECLVTETQEGLPIQIKILNKGRVVFFSDLNFLRKTEKISKFLKESGGTTH